jgi:hypothetical protein
MNDLEASIDDVAFQSNDQLTLLREDVLKKIDGIKEGYMPKWMAYLITILISVIGIETTILLTRFYGG